MRSGQGSRFLAVLIAGTLLTISGPVFAEEGEIIEETEGVVEEISEVPDEVLDEIVEEIPEEGFIEIEVDDNEGFVEDLIDIPVDEEESVAVEVESTEEIPEESLALWQYQYAGNPNKYLETVCEWLAVYHMDSVMQDTGMIPAVSIVGVDDSDRNDIRLYGFFQISDYAVEGTTLVDVYDELLTGCMHLQQLSEDEYIVQTAEVLDSSNMTGSAKTLTGGDPVLMQGLLTGGISEADRAQYIRDFVWTYGIGAEYYQDDNLTVHPIGFEGEDSPTWVENLSEASVTDQIITVGKTSGSNANLMLHEKQEDGSWSCVLNVPALIGKEGLGKTVEGDSRTPVGTYGFTEAFGMAEDPGSIIPYTQCDDTYYWVEDSASGRYNQLVSTAQYTDFSKDESERIADNGTALRYALALSYNEDGIPYGGSGIFIHCSKPQSFSTAGCISIPEEAVEYLLQHLKSSARVIIDTQENLKTQHLNVESRPIEAIA